MIAVKIIGRLGNQLFQYAFGYASAKRKRTIFFIDYPNSDNYILTKYFKLRKFENYLNKIIKVLSNRVLNRSRDFSNLFQYGHEPINEILDAVNGNTYLEGYFQSELFFREYQKNIKNLFEIKKKYIITFKSNYKHFFNKPLLVMHFRGGDYFNWKISTTESSVVLPFKYYDECLKKIENLEDYKIVWVSDSIDYVRSYYGDQKGFHYSNDNEINDFIFLLNADILIISNSSFAWWGAYLNKKNAKVFAPKYWLTFIDKTEYPIGISSMDWEWIEI